MKGSTAQRAGLDRLDPYRIVCRHCCDWSGRDHRSGDRSVPERAVRNPVRHADRRQPQPGATIKAVPGSRAQGWLAQGRSEVLARHGMVATSDPLAAQAGLEILRQGGNAIDAAVATGAVLDVTSQNDTGIGGDLFALVWSRERQEAVRAELRPAGRRPAGRREFFTETARREGDARQRRERGDGARRDLRLRRAAEALRHADLQGDVRARGPHRRGRLGPGGAPSRRSAQRRQSGCAPTRIRRQTFLIDDEAPPLYSIIRNPAWRRRCASSSSRAATRSTRATSPTAIVAKVQANGGVMTEADLAEFQSEWVEPISTNYHGYDVFELPPPGQGFAALEMLNILEVCVPKLGHEPRDARAVEPDVLAPDGRSEEARLRGSAGAERRSEVRDRCRSTSCCRSRYAAIAVQPDQPERRLDARPSPAAPTAARSISRPPIAGATWCR